MTATQVQRRRGTAAQCDAMTPADAEIIVDQTNDTIRVGDGVTAGGLMIPNHKQIVQQVFNYATAGGTANALTITPLKPCPPPGNGSKLQFKAAFDNTSAMTLDDGNGAVAINVDLGTGMGGVPAGTVKLGQIYEVVHDGTVWQLKFAIPNFSAIPQNTMVSASAAGANPVQINMDFTTYSEYEIQFNMGMSGSNGYIIYYSTDNVNYGQSFNQNGQKNAQSPGPNSITFGLDKTYFAYVKMKFVQLSTSSGLYVEITGYYYNGSSFQTSGVEYVAISAPLTSIRLINGSSSGISMNYIMKPMNKR